MVPRDSSGPGDQVVDRGGGGWCGCDRGGGVLPARLPWSPADQGASWLSYLAVTAFTARTSIMACH